MRKICPAWQAWKVWGYNGVEISLGLSVCLSVSLSMWGRERERDYLALRSHSAVEVRCLPGEVLLAYPLMPATRRARQAGDTEGHVAQKDQRKLFWPPHQSVLVSGLNHTQVC